MQCVKSVVHEQNFICRDSIRHREVFCFTRTNSFQQTAQLFFPRTCFIFLHFKLFVTFMKCFVSSICNLFLQSEQMIFLENVLLIQSCVKEIQILGKGLRSRQILIGSWFVMIKKYCILRIFHNLFIQLIKRYLQIVNLLNIFWQQSLIGRNLQFHLIHHRNQYDERTECDHLGLKSYRLNLQSPTNNYF